MIIGKKNTKVSSILGVFLLLLSFSCSSGKKLIKSGSIDANNKYINLSIELMSAAKGKEEGLSIRKKLAEVHPDTLKGYLVTDNQKKAFWINVYNAHIQFFLSKKPERFENRGKFFGAKQITIAQKLLSFDDIEHGIIRSSKFKLALGLIKNPFAGKYEKQFRTRKTDGRVHFALNCGAKSCPLVATYDAANFDSKINEVAQNFLRKMSTYNKEENKIITTTLFSWFRGDFGGKGGIIKLLKNYEIIPKGADPEIEYDTYDWTLSLGNYYEK